MISDRIRQSDLSGNDLGLATQEALEYLDRSLDSGFRPGMGHFIIMDHILRARAGSLPYVYLGYWVKGSPRMAYKTRYQPLEALGPRGWATFNGEQPAPAAPPPVEALG